MVGFLKTLMGVGYFCGGGVQRGSSTIGFSGFGRGLVYGVTGTPAGVGTGAYTGEGTAATGSVDS